ncbi:HD domain-containing protein [Pleurocapsa sp. FMAR1]|uniref:HD domain-containing protein n=1 Tax=Pleurocapsa sp. FMAR1 TaxID=3040204 RepID=UPI0029C74B59|nr:hypothetical protein [Pleurocapsa sp. FMAR1]
MNLTMRSGIPWDSLVEDIVTIFEKKGDCQYGGESISQLEHALQCATLAEAEGSSQELIVASLLHDLGHLLSDTEETSQNDFHGAYKPRPSRTRSAPHEYKAIPQLKKLFGFAVSEPVRLHVEAKRYLCAIDSNYWESLSPASKQSLKWQGRIFSEKEAKAFIALPFAQQAVQLRHWDDEAKVVDLSTRDLNYFVPFLTACIK